MEKIQTIEFVDRMFDDMSRREQAEEEVRRLAAEAQEAQAIQEAIARRENEIQAVLDEDIARRENDILERAAFRTFYSRSG